VGYYRKDVVRIVNIDTFGHVVINSLEYVEDEAVEDNLFQDKDIDVFLEKNQKIGKILLYPTFMDLNSL